MPVGGKQLHYVEIRGNGDVLPKTKKKKLYEKPDKNLTHPIVFFFF